MINGWSSKILTLQKRNLTNPTLFFTPLAGCRVYDERVRVQQRDPAEQQPPQRNAAGHHRQNGLSLRDAAESPNPTAGQ